MEAMLKELIADFEATFANFPCTEQESMNKAVVWYNKYRVHMSLMLPVFCEEITSVTPDTYYWAHACGLLVTAGAKSRLV
jgi:hypothetical protein